MKPMWNLGSESTDPVVLSRRFDVVLVEYDGPQLATFVDSAGARFIGVASDSDDTGTRWLHVPIDQSDIDSLIAKKPMRDVFLKGGASLVDIDWEDRTIRAWESVAALDIPEGALPVAGAPFPSWCRDMLAAEDATNQPPVATPTAPYGSERTCYRTRRRRERERDDESGD